jgi:hypothetical protein
MFGILDNISPLLGQLMPRMGMSFAEEGAGDGDIDGNDGSDGKGAGSDDDGNDSGDDSSFYNGFSPEVRNHPSIKKFKSAEEMGKGYLNLEKKIGEKGIIKPREGAPKEEIDAYYQALGRPEAPDKYTWDTPENIHPAIQITPELENSYRDVAFKLGLTAEQAAALRMYHLDSLTAQINTQEQAQKDALLKAETDLRKEYGAAFEEKVNTAKKVVDTFGGDAVKAELNKTGLGNNPALVKMLADIGSKLGEDSIAKGGKPSGMMTPEQAKAEIKRMNTEATQNPKHPLMDDMHPEHKEAIAKRDSLYKLAYPENESA